MKVMIVVPKPRDFAALKRSMGDTQPNTGTCPKCSGPCACNCRSNEHVAQVR